jgi:hypothetical protein
VRRAAARVALGALSAACAAAPAAPVAHEARPQGHWFDEADEAGATGPEHDAGAGGMEGDAHTAAEHLPDESREGGVASPRVLLVDETPSYVTPSGQVATQRPALRKRGRRGHPYHPDPRVVIDVVEARGAATAADLQRTARDSGYWPVRRCFEEGLRRDQNLGGKVSIALTISPDGQVERSSATGSSVTDRAVVACVAREARRISFSPADGPTNAVAGVSLGAGDEPVAVFVAIPDAERLRRSLRGAWPGAEDCYVRALARDPGAGGRVELVFRVSGSGRIESIAETAAPPDDAELTSCVSAVYRAAQLPDADSGHARRFLYALHFETDPTTSEPEPR